MHCHQIDMPQCLLQMHLNPACAVSGFHLCKSCIFILLSVGILIDISNKTSIFRQVSSSPRLTQRYYMLLSLFLFRISQESTLPVSFICSSTHQSQWIFLSNKKRLPRSGYVTDLMPVRRGFRKILISGDDAVIIPAVHRKNRIYRHMLQKPGHSF